MTIPAPPTTFHGDRCLRCRHWLAADVQEFVMMPTGPVPLKAIPPANRVEVAQFKRQTAAPCTFLPNWALQPADGWCWQWVANTELKTVEGQ